MSKSKSNPDDAIRALFNSLRDGTASDAIGRHRCRVALGERCIGDDGMPGDGKRYPTADEMDEARRVCLEIWTRRSR